MELQTLKTPSLVLDVERVRSNAARIASRVKDLGARLRPHVKTHKCVEIARLQTTDHFGGITVSTLAEAHVFAEHNFKDIIYAVPIEPGKFNEAIETSRSCENLALLIDDLETTTALNAAARTAGATINLYLKVDCGYHRCGVEPHSREAIAIPQAITDSSNLRFAGILTHAGHSYHCRSREESVETARHERDLMTDFADHLRASGVPVPVVSIGSTPTITHIDHLDGVDEVRAGNYIFFDAFQHTLGSCAAADCALTVLAAVIHRDRSQGQIVIDAGATALSKDRGPVEFDPACGYGRVLDLGGRDLGLRINSLSQEHGIIKGLDDELLDHLKTGSRIRILANHSCLAVAQHTHFHVLENNRIVDQWAIHRGW